MRQFSEACERNKGPILDVIKPYLQHSNEVLEVGSGTGQHAAYFAGAMPHLTWHTSDLRANHPSIMAWVESSELPNLRKPRTLDVSQAVWPVNQADAIFTANTCHIMSWERVLDLFQGANRVLKPGGHLLIYGPFNVNGQYTSESNKAFDASLKERDPESGLRDYDDMNRVARHNGFSLIQRHDMPANNMLLAYQKNSAF
ncbi:MAG: class I SAM-dependent methyltransferase [Kangiella sp.]|jgi:SAM-dependent methyltransferase|nr:class I SAM-dependent methyltransferase [Kangiella sp.]MCW9027397.1 class I SAM-dependent methyltransferase [Kangiella sp.]